MAVRSSLVGAGAVSAPRTAETPPSSRSAPPPGGAAWEGALAGPEPGPSRSGSSPPGSPAGRRWRGIRRLLENRVTEPEKYRSSVATALTQSVRPRADGFDLDREIPAANIRFEIQDGGLGAEGGLQLSSGWPAYHWGRARRLCTPAFRAAAFRCRCAARPHSAAPRCWPASRASAPRDLPHAGSGGRRCSQCRRRRASPRRPGRAPRHGRTRGCAARTAPGSGTRSPGAGFSMKAGVRRLARKYMVSGLPAAAPRALAAGTLPATRRPQATEASWRALLNCRYRSRP